MRKNSGMIGHSGAYTSPGTLEYGDDNVGGIPKSWSTERVPLPTSWSSRRRHVSASALIPFTGGRTLPSKWDDAERWITSPVSGRGHVRTPIAQPRRRPESESGRLRPPEFVHSSNYSASTPDLEGGSVRSFMGKSPLTVPDGLLMHYDAGIVAKADSFHAENNVSQSTGVPGLSISLGETSVRSSQDDKLDGGKEEEAWFSKVVCRRDMATQMSPEGSTHSPFSIIISSIATQANPAAKAEVRDVPVDRGAAAVRRSKKQEPKKIKKNLSNVKDTLPQNASEASKNTSKLQREEAKIMAWENLQKAKAEASVRKLEMKLEKKRSESMDKILKKLRAAQMKAEAMRNSMSENDAPQVPTTPHWRIPSSIKPYSPRNCFLCNEN